MKKMKYAKIALAAVISAALLQGGTALAKKKGELSVYEWGPWAVMARPAAGPQFVAFTPKGNPDPYHPTPKPVPPTPPPPTPVPVVEQHIGWATYRYAGENGAKSPILASFVMSMQSTDKQTSGSLSGSAQINASYVVYPPILSKLLIEDYPKVASLPGMPGSVEKPNVSFVGLTFTHFVAKDIVGSPETTYKMDIYKPWNLDMVVGHWSKIKQQSTQSGYFVYGTTTSLAAIDGLQAGNVTAHYTGKTMANSTPVDITIDFGNRSWHGYWNKNEHNDNISDGRLTYKTDSRGVVYATGHIGFMASGHLSGSNMIMDHLSTPGQSNTDITGVVKNAVFGNKAQVVGGGYQVTKTNDTSGTFTQSDITIAVLAK